MDVNLPLVHLKRKRSTGYHPGNAGIYYSAYKRIFDVAAALLFLVLGWPLLLLVAILIKLDTPGPVIFRQVRIGKGGKPFSMLKFRTMQEGGDELLAEHLSHNPALKLSYEQYQKLKDDPRLTRAGQSLRRLSLDELPQLWNVIKGEMSLVGPRPFLPEQKALYGVTIGGYVQALPGITGLWQVSGRNQLSFYERARLDEYYLEHRSFNLDLRILWRTVWIVMTGRGAY
jgi:lipopolysaccharide/colanic/teichoic acid biosynthesis glycosyltransferase